MKVNHGPQKPRGAHPHRPKLSTVLHCLHSFAYDIDHLTNQRNLTLRVRCVKAHMLKMCLTHVLHLLRYTTLCEFWHAVLKQNPHCVQIHVQCVQHIVCHSLNTSFVRAYESYKCGAYYKHKTYKKYWVKIKNVMWHFTSDPAFRSEG